MAIYKVKQVWNKNHTESERNNITNFCLDLYKSNLFIPLTTTAVVVDEDGTTEMWPEKFSEFVPDNVNTQYVVTKFATESGAQQYINFISNLNPVSVTIEVEN